MYVVRTTLPGSHYHFGFPSPFSLSLVVSAKVAKAFSFYEGEKGPLCVSGAEKGTKVGRGEGEGRTTTTRFSRHTANTTCDDISFSRVFANGKEIKVDGPGVGLGIEQEIECLLPPKRNCGGLSGFPLSDIAEGGSADICDIFSSSPFRRRRALRWPKQCTVQYFIPLPIHPNSGKEDFV